MLVNLVSNAEDRQPPVHRCVVPSGSDTRCNQQRLKELEPPKKRQMQRRVTRARGKMLEVSNNQHQKQRQRDQVEAPWTPPDEFRAISLRVIAELLDTTRSSARRWLREAGIRPIALGRGAKGAIRYRWTDVEAWLKSRQYVE